MAEALTGVGAGRVLSRERSLVRDADAVGIGGRHHRAHRYREMRPGPARSQTPCRYGNTSHEKLEVLGAPAADGAAGRVGKSKVSLKRAAAAGVEGETWRHYGEQLEENLRDLAARLKRGTYRAQPVRRVYIPKADGRRRPRWTSLSSSVVTPSGPGLWHAASATRSGPAAARVPWIGTPASVVFAREARRPGCRADSLAGRLGSLPSFSVCR